ncbi:unnamed protein product [Amoebophrya sp. A25]|nr:unnamed protein product [Amoebophrya sp. A25]|eukprot:GSA25T00003313001.1
MRIDDILAAPVRLAPHVSTLEFGNDAATVPGPHHPAPHGLQPPSCSTPPTTRAELDRIQSRAGQGASGAESIVGKTKGGKFSGSSFEDYNQERWSASGANRHGQYHQQPSSGDALDKVLNLQNNKDMIPSSSYQFGRVSASGAATVAIAGASSRAVNSARAEHQMSNNPFVIHSRRSSSNNYGSSSSSGDVNSRATRRGRGGHGAGGRFNNYAPAMLSLPGSFHSSSTTHWSSAAPTSRLPVVNSFLRGPSSKGPPSSISATELHVLPLYATVGPAAAAGAAQHHQGAAATARSHQLQPTTSSSNSSGRGGAFFHREESYPANGPLLSSPTGRSSRLQPIVEHRSRQDHRTPVGGQAGMGMFTMNMYGNGQDDNQGGFNNHSSAGIGGAGVQQGAGAAASSSTVGQSRLFMPASSMRKEAQETLSKILSVGDHAKRSHTLNMLSGSSKLHWGARLVPSWKTDENVETGVRNRF